MHNLTILLSILVFLCVHCEARYFETRCQLVRELRKQGLPEEQMRDWVCLIENESGRVTDKISGLNRNGSRDCGLFQINDKYWCNNEDTRGKDCNVTCSEILRDITKASNCAKIIFKRHGFMAWYGWRDHCQGKTLPDISGC